MYDPTKLIGLIDQFIEIYETNIDRPSTAYSLMVPIIEAINNEATKVGLDPDYIDRIILVNNIWYVLNGPSVEEG